MKSRRYTCTLFLAALALPCLLCVLPGCPGPGDLDGDRSFAIDDAFAVVCESEDGEILALGVVGSHGECETDGPPGMGDDCKEMRDFIQDNPILCDSGVELSNSREHMVQFWLRGASSMDDFSAATASSALHYECSHQDEEDFWIGDTEYLEGSVSVLSDNGGSAEIDIDVEGLTGTLNFDVCR